MSTPEIADYAGPRLSPVASPNDRYVPSESAHHPWRRYFARNLDPLICGALWLAVYTLGEFHIERIA